MINNSNNLELVVYGQISVLPKYLYLHKYTNNATKKKNHLHKPTA